MRFIRAEELEEQRRAVAMTTGLGRESAKIYEFPVHNTQRLREMRERNLHKQVILESGAASWYHEAAIREAEDALKQ
ncbi:DUF2735 domain-containing protein [Allorhizobium ampelinum]|uniref:Glutamine synthetase translation inhibitor n=2 Tax=Rhizobium/Agrobacterium group TaxID=227290 RepID=B9JZT8_ALLAM|nr:DUF2735 domain-containing protein [Agrobacterium vitis]ACM37398.1 glutamine synthetase translation inhibitor [Allorhizobium ampelinum S4]OVE94265.1 DUF2735 domain-containing protein [Allorhizobium ampelinum]